MTSNKKAILILADGSRPDVFTEELAAGNLPHIAKNLVEPGLFKSLVTTFPSTTGPAYLPYLTGQDAGICNVPGIRWFDKQHYHDKGWGFGSFRSYVGLESFLFDGDISPNVKTVWESVPDSYNILNVITRGLPVKKDVTHYRRVFDFFLGHQTDRWDRLDDLAGNFLLNIVKQKDFRFVFCVFPGIDEYSHRTSPFSPIVRASYKRLDDWIGKLVQNLKQRGIHEQTWIGIVSDHGLSETHTHFDIGPWMSTEKNIKTFYYTNIFKFNFDAVSMVSGNGMTHLYFKGERGWNERVTFEEITMTSILLDELRFRPEIDLVAVRGADGSVHVLSENGHGIIQVSESENVKLTIPRSCPFKIFSKNDSRLQGSLSFDDFYNITLDEYYPDVIYQLWQVFFSPRCGDVIVTAKSGFDLRQKFETPLHVASHGSLCHEHMRIPFLCNQKNSQTLRRSRDVHAALMRHLVSA